MRALLLTAALALAACDTADDGFIVPYTGPEITEADALLVDAFGFERGWSLIVEVEGRTQLVSLARTELCGDECSRTVSFRFSGPVGDLPTAVASVVVEDNALPTSRTQTELRVERVEIQRWAPSEFSGVVYPAPGADASTAPIVFWANAVAD